MTVPKYNSVVKRHFDFSIANKFQTFLFYPKLVLVKEKLVQVLDLSGNHELPNDSLFEMEDIVVEGALQHHLLWILLQNGNLVLINVNKGTMAKVELTNYYKITKITMGNNLKLISESEEELIVPLTFNDLADKMENEENVVVTLSKNYKIHKNSFSKTAEVTSSGLRYLVEEGTLLCECSITGVQTEIISSVTQLKYSLAWGDFLILADTNVIWIVDMITGDILSELKSDDFKYHPVATHLNAFYYISIGQKDISVITMENAVDLVNDLENSEDTSASRQHSQEFLKTQLKSMVEGFLSQVPAPNPDEVAIKLRPFLDVINDCMFLIVILRKLSETKMFSKSYAFLMKNKIIGLNDDKVIYHINDFCIKLDIIEYIHFKGNITYNDSNIFEYSFSELCMQFISNCDFDLASMCWLKYVEIIKPLSANDVSNILNAIPSSAKMGMLIIWLRNFIPPLLDQNPYNIDLFVRWTTDRVFKLEKLAYWPKIGLKFIDDIKNVLKSSTKTITIIPLSMDDLDLLRDQILYIMEMKEKYKINMYLNELCTKNPTEVALIMLHRCYTEDLDNFIKCYIPTFATRHSLDLDEILTTYIENEASSGRGNIDESRFGILIEAFRMPNNKLVCLLSVLRVLEVPWNKTIQEIAVKVAAMGTNDFTFNDNERNLAREIAEELSYANLKVVLKKYNFSLTCTDYNLVLHKIVHTPIVSLQDLKTVMNVMTADKNYGSILYLNRCLRDFNTKEALHYFGSLSKADGKKILKALITKYEHILDSEEMRNGMERCYIDFFKGTNMLDVSQLNMIENMYHLKNSHNVRMNVNAMSCERAQISSENDSERSRYLTRLMNVRLTQNSALLDLLHRTSSCGQVRQVIESLISSLTQSPELSRDNILQVLSNFNDGKNLKLLLDSCKVMVQLVINCREEHLNYITNIMYLLNALMNTVYVVRNLTVVWKFNFIYLPMSSISTTNDLIKFLSTQTLDEQSDFGANLCIKNDLLPLRVFSNIAQKKVIMNVPLDENIIELRERSTKKILTKIIMSNEIDELLLTTLLMIMELSISEEEKQMWLFDVFKGQHDTLSPNIVSYLSLPSTRRCLCINDELARSAASYAPQILKNKFNMNLAEIAIPDTTEETWDIKLILFYVLKNNKDITLDGLIDMCRTLNDVTVDDGLSLYLIALLSSWELKYETYTDDLGFRQLNTESDESLLDKCQIIWESIKNKSFLKDILKDFWKNGEVSLHGRLISINPYYYEVYLCIYHLIFGTTSDTKNAREYFLLYFLKDYKRKSKPQQYEFELFSAKGVFPEIGYYRLPFQLFMRDDMWSNLKSEITLETYELWLPAVALLCLDSDLQTARDMVCSNALKQSMKTKKPEKNESETNDSEPWRLSTKEEPLLRAAHRCVRHIANMEWAGACLFYVLQGCARGADQVAAAQLCYQFSQRWNALQPGNRAVRKMERLHSTLSTRHVLHKINWASEDLVHLTVEPTQLIRTMYLHPQLVEKMARYDVNKAANEIADKNGININSIRIQILESILDNNGIEHSKQKTIGLTNNELITAKYILKVTCPKMGAIYLSRIAFDEESDFNKSKKLRALQCLMSIVDSDTAKKVTNRDRQTLWQDLLDIYYVIYLELIDMPWVVETFMQDKIRAIDQARAAVGSNTNSLKVVAELTRRYANIETINNILPVMLRANLYEDTIPLLLKNYYPPNENIRAAWHAVLLWPFECADYPLTDKQKSNCLKAMNLLPFCPAINDNDLKEIWKHCVRCKSYGIACLMLPYMTYETRNSLTELRRIDRRNLIASLKNLQTETFLVLGAMSVLESMTSRNYR